jgi:hypothetical protein
MCVCSAKSAWQCKAHLLKYVFESHIVVKCVVCVQLYACVLPVFLRLFVATYPILIFLLFCVGHLAWSINGTVCQCLPDSVKIRSLLCETCSCEQYRIIFQEGVYSKQQFGRHFQENIIKCIFPPKVMSDGWKVVIVRV